MMTHDITINRAHLGRVLGMPGLTNIALAPTTARLTFATTRTPASDIVAELLRMDVRIIGASPREDGMKTEPELPGYVLLSLAFSAVALVFAAVALAIRLM